jgi:hypothetical protein
MLIIEHFGAMFREPPRISRETAVRNRPLAAFNGRTQIGRNVVLRVR